MERKGICVLLHLMGGFRPYQEFPGAEGEAGPFPKTDDGISDWPLFIYESSDTGLQARVVFYGRNDRGNEFEEIAVWCEN